MSGDTWDALIREARIKDAAREDAAKASRQASRNVNTAAPIERVRPVLIDPRELTMEPTEFLDDAYRVPLGMTTVLVGDGGLGKSLYAILLGASITEAGDGVIFASAEDDRSKTWKPRLVAVGVDLSRVRMLRLQHEGEPCWDESIAIPDDLLAIRKAVRSLDHEITPGRVKLIVVDPLEAHLSDERDDGNSSTRRRQTLGPLEALAGELDVAFLLVHHVNKDTSLRASHRVLGTVANRNAPRSLLLFGPNPSEHLPEGVDVGVERVLLHDKHNVSPKSPSQLFRVVPTVVFEDDGTRIPTARLDFVREIEVDPEAVFGRGVSNEERSALGEAKGFLASELEHGPQPTAKVNKAADGLGISKRTLERARRDLAVEPFKDGETWKLRLPLLEKSTPPTLGGVGGTGGVDREPETRMDSRISSRTTANSANDGGPGGLGGVDRQDESSTGVELLLDNDLEQFADLFREEAT